MKFAFIIVFVAADYFLATSNPGIDMVINFVLAGILGLSLVIITSSTIEAE